eukprot:1974929-Amphidinium_carterae.1
MDRVFEEKKRLAEERAKEEMKALENKEDEEKQPTNSRTASQCQMSRVLARSWHQSEQVDLYLYMRKTGSPIHPHPPKNGLTYTPTYDLG